MDMHSVTNRLERLGKPIWERLYMASLRFKDSLSEDEIRQFGMPTTGDPRIDREVHNEYLVRQDL